MRNRLLSPPGWSLWVVLGIIVGGAFIAACESGSSPSTTCNFGRGFETVEDCRIIAQTQSRGCQQVVFIGGQGQCTGSICRSCN